LTALFYCGTSVVWNLLDRGILGPGKHMPPGYHKLRQNGLSQAKRKKSMDRKIN
jgi:hypothetical protein